VAAAVFLARRRPTEEKREIAEGRRISKPSSAIAWMCRSRGCARTFLFDVSCEGTSAVGVASFPRGGGLRGRGSQMPSPWAGDADTLAAIAGGGSGHVLWGTRPRSPRKHSGRLG